MKKIGLIIALAVISAVAFSQSRKVTSANNYLKDGFLIDAKKSIDEAEQHSETANSYKTYYYKGKIYHQIGASTEPKFQNLCGNDCFDIAYKSYLKSIELNIKNPDFKGYSLETEEGLKKFEEIFERQNSRDYEDSQSLMDILMNCFPALSQGFINLGIDLYAEQKYNEAYDLFLKAMNISIGNVKPDLVYVTALAALKSEKYEKAVECFKILIKTNYGKTMEEKVEIYSNMAKAYSLLGNETEMLATLEEGIKKYPKANYPLIIEVYNYNVTSGDKSKALDYINIAIEKNPNDAQFYVVKGDLLNEMNQKEEAVTSFEKALALDPENYDANYSLGAFYYNNGVDTIKAADNLPSTDFAKMDEYGEAGKVLFAQALPYLEKAYSKKPKDVALLDILRIIYRRVGKFEEFNKINAELEELIKKE